MNEKLSTRRGLFTVLGSAMAGVGSALLFRKLRKSEGSVPATTPRVPLSEKVGTWFNDELKLVSVRDDSGHVVDYEAVPKSDTRPDSFSEVYNNKMLARTLKEQDEAILLDENYFWKDEIIERFGESVFDEEDEWKGYSQGKLTDEEFAAYQRWLNSDYPVTKIASSGSDVSRDKETVPSDSGTREQDERLIAA